MLTSSMQKLCIAGPSWQAVEAPTAMLLACSICNCVQKTAQQVAATPVAICESCQLQGISNFDLVHFMIVF